MEYRFDRIGAPPRMLARDERDRARRRAELRREWESDLDRVAIRAAVRSRSLILAMAAALAILGLLTFVG
jgi:hypothetical protein